MDHPDIIDYWPTSIQEGLNWFPFMNIVEYNSDRIDNDITLLPSLLNIFKCFKFVVGIIMDTMIKIKWKIFL